MKRLSEDGQKGHSKLPMNDGIKIERKLSYYVVLFLDLLGQREIIGKLQDLRCLQDDEATYYRRFGEAAGKVWGVRACLAQWIAACLRDTPPNGPGVPKVKLQMFSDTVIAYFAVDEENPNCFLALRAFIIATAVTMTHALAAGVPMRGGLDYHIATDFSDQNASSDTITSGGDLWGPAPKLAYELAEKQAEYPRILIGNGLPEIIHKLAERISTRLKDNPESAPRVLDQIEAAKQVMSIMATDPNDNKTILDYLRYRLWHQSDQQLHESLRQAYRFAVSQHKQFTGNGADTLAERYRKLLYYMESRQEPNGILPAGTIPKSATNV